MMQKHQKICLWISIILAAVALLGYVLLCCALGCISGAIASPGTYFGVLQGGLEGSLEGRTGVFIASWNLPDFYERSYAKRVGLITV